MVSLMVGSLLPVSPSLTVADCPECRGISTVIFGTCGVCFAEFFEDDDYLSHGRIRPTRHVHDVTGGRGPTYKK
jgi:hypothetical protein